MLSGLAPIVLKGWPFGARFIIYSCAHFATDGINGALARTTLVAAKGRYCSTNASPLAIAIKFGRRVPGWIVLRIVYNL